MKYVGTRPGSEIFSSSQAIWQGISSSGGLFVPQEFPHVSLVSLSALQGLHYHEKATAILPLFLTDYEPEAIAEFCHSAYSAERFESLDCAPVKQLDASTWVLELWHGPTCAFKDIALQMLPKLLTSAMVKVGSSSGTNPGVKGVAILVATSGDTGKAAMEGFADIPGTSIVVFYPHGGVSKVQEAQMATQRGENVFAVAVDGNFDDTQTGVKRIFADASMAKRAAAAGLSFSSANSINWGRLVPQIVYYFSAYADMLQSGAIELGEKINFVVPTGNFGNILAGYYAKCMGLPVGKLVCASNTNNVLTDFFRKGEYDRRRPFVRTSSPSMDILISSNLERLLFEVAGRNPVTVANWMSHLAEEGTYSLDGAGTHLSSFWADFATEEETSATIKAIWETHHYLIDTHTAVAFNVMDKYRRETGDETPCVVLSTASPFKFNADVARALLGEEAIANRDEFQLLDDLSTYTGVPVPKPLLYLQQLPIRHTSRCDKSEMAEAVEEMLGI